MVVGSVMLFEEAVLVACWLESLGSRVWLWESMVLCWDMIFRYDPEICVVSSEYYSLVIGSARYRRDSQVDDRKKSCREPMEDDE